MRIENLYAKSCVIEHLFSKFDNKAGLGYVVPTQEKTRNQLYYYS